MRQGMEEFFTQIRCGFILLSHGHGGTLAIEATVESGGFVHQDGLVSVVTPAFNAGRYLAETIESCLAQTHGNLELLIVDDGSTDDTQDIAERYARADSRIRVFHIANSGVAVARNVALEHARGAYVALLDSDDVWMPEFLERQLDTLSRYPAFDVVTSNAFNRGGPFHGEGLWPVSQEIRPISLIDMIVREEAVNIFSVFRRTVIERVEGFDQNFTGNEDYHFWLRAAVAGCRFVGDFTPRGYYRRRTDSASANQRRMLAGILNVFNNLRPQLPAGPALQALDAQVQRFTTELLMAEARECVAAGNPAGGVRFLERIPSRDRGAMLSILVALGGVWPSLLSRSYRMKRAFRELRLRFARRRHARTIAIMICLAVCGRATEAATIAVPAGGDLQSALVNAKAGDTIELAAGATFVGNFTLPVKMGAADTFITIQSSPDPSLAAEGGRIAPSDAPHLAKLRSPNSSPALQTETGAHHWRIQLLEFEAGPDGSGTIVALGDASAAQSSLAQVPHDLIIDRCYIHGAPNAAQRRGIALNSATTRISGSYIAEMKSVGEDSQAIMGWNGPGPFVIDNNYLEGAGENVLFGGGDPSIPKLVPSDITITGNTLSRPTSWRGQRWQIKNILELKNARRVRIADNLLENNWAAAQSGFAVLFTVRNQDGGCSWCQVEQVVFEGNIVQHSAAAIQILGVDDNAKSEQTRSITIRNNLFADIDNDHWGGNGYFLQVTGAPRDITVDHNTIIQEHASGIAQVEGPPVLGFVFTNNLVRHNAYGIIGQDRAPGSDTISAYFPASLIVGNVIADGDPRRYPAGNRFPSSAEFRSQFVEYDRGDFRLIPASPWNAAGTDGVRLGADLTALPTRATGRQPPPRPVRPDAAAAIAG
jgi:glycosyltransferase involved in cell wall biosynthesis